MVFLKHICFSSRSRSGPGFLILILLAVLMFLLLWNSKGSHPFVNMSNAKLEEAMRFVTQKLKPEHEIRISVKKQIENVTECPILDFFASIDPTAKQAYSKSFLCDELAKSSDILCRIYLQQNGMGHLEEEKCRLKDPGKVPRIAYFVIFGHYDSQFWHYVAVKAARKFLNASAIYVIGDQQPSGRWWKDVMKEVPDLRFVHREKPLALSGKAVQWPHHFSDAVRLQVLLMNGGIYLDADMVVVRDLEPLLDFDLTLGLLDPGSGMGNAFIVAKRNNTFLREWYANYTDFHPSEIYWNSLQVGRDLWYKNKSRVHMESERIYKPNWFEADLLFKKPDYPWRKNYAVHIWTNGNKVPTSHQDIANANTTVAKVFRYILYGDDKVIAKQTLQRK